MWTGIQTGANVHVSLHNKVHLTNVQQTPAKQLLLKLPNIAVHKERRVLNSRGPKRCLLCTHSPKKPPVLGALVAEALNIQSQTWNHWEELLR
jgi:hypothetical protein